MMPPRLRRLALPAAFLLLAALVFRAGWPSGQTILSSDYNFSNLALYRNLGFGAFFSGYWHSSNLLGSQGVLPLSFTNLVLMATPLSVFTDWIYALHLLLASTFLLLFLRRSGVGLPAAALGALVAYWTGSNLTLIYAGHLYKYGVLTFGALSLYALERAVTARSLPWALLAGGAAALMAVEQQDLAIFHGLLLAAYAVHAVCRERRRAPADYPVSVLARLALPALALAALILVEPYRRTKAVVIDTASITRADPVERWHWATQWSWPPDETLDFIAPGYFGLRSGEREGPYWGRMGRTEGWETRGQGFGNFKLESQYMGATAVLLLAFAGLAAWRLRGTGGTRSGETAFWLAAALVLFLLSCGKYLPFYRLIYHLPLLSSIRNPNKFLQILQVAMGVGAAFGLDALAGQARAALAARWTPAHTRRFLYGGCGLAALLALLLATAAAGPADTATLARLGLAPLAETVRSLKLAALGHGLGVTLVSVGLIALALLRPRHAGRAAGGLLAVLAVDVLLLSRHYLLAKDIAATRDNPVAQWLAQRLDDRRVHAPDQQGVYGYVIANDFPYHGVHYANLLAAPRLDKDYEEFLTRVGRNLPLFWDLFGVKYVLAPAPLAQRLQSLPGLLKPVLGWNPQPTPDGGLRSVIAAAGQPAQHLVLELQRGGARARFSTAWKVASAEETLAALADPAGPGERVYIAAETARELPPASTGDSPPAPPVQLTKSRAELRATVEAPAPGVLWLADKHSPRLRVEVNGQPAPLLRCQHLFPGVHLPAGRHEVRFWFAPSGDTRLLLLGWLITLGAAGGAVWSGLSAQGVRMPKR